MKRLLCLIGMHDWEHWLNARTCWRCSKTQYINGSRWGAFKKEARYGRHV